MPSKKIPTLIGIFLVIALITIVSVVHKQVIGKFITAAPSAEPQNIRLTNVSDTSFTVTWNTATPAVGSISLSGLSVSGQVFFDERDVNMAKKENSNMLSAITKPPLGKYNSHSVSIRDLSPGNEYRYRIVSNGRTYPSEAIIKTAVSLTQPEPGYEPAYGTVFTAENLPASGALVYLTLDGSQVLSSLVSDTGSWIIPINTIRTENLAAYLPSQERTDELITVVRGQEIASAVTDTLNDSPVPLILLGKSYDFRKTQAQAPEAALPQLAIFPTAIPTQAAVLGETSLRNLKFSLTQPADKAALVSNLPLLSGTGIPGNTVLLEFGTGMMTQASAEIKPEGIWRYTPVNPIPAGKVVLKATSKDSTGKDVTIIREFEVLKSGTQVLGEATPSGTLSPTATPVASQSPTIALSPTPTSTVSGQPVSGVTGPTVLLIALGLILLVGGGFLMAL
ncbi:hypothetical protein A2Z33_02315 [Candidatus Gottesmanbacteria bacterium RBG_16_52_11]|uniref:Fibronectin type-III domain-containing protein n=1 Tax=Candidatus Gottesmanbacteria bacterium RBG_16_52_11 TaxID=1798374 RepID=A0A1F5YME9_9BACT|nr:MAG: hypothetical protein A2Z33_02315 [Candidatus Gottesmanbacteria bacterium RBG_16_52_11]